ncbi:ArsR/SmtB family transcription factor [Kurthia sibirica]|uniref:ArsR family transcriptional regulator n=1 Tax=Kurthia sibirica TaxID=202750 RepID=A0A2U3AN20_9BACL|nr:metalloregulator ArsR/SmtB family transcription factor [Kurthia sibirica]PWI25938.1 ArsR family transcriptional regulator [Kurthia sibirica]GEK35142.1 transcriptional regulator [Kurthia sibirica]
METIHSIERQLKAISDLNRLKILACLKTGEQCVCDLVAILQISQPAVSQQLRKLKEAGIIVERKKGTWKHYRLHDRQSLYIQAVIDELPALYKENSETYYRVE